MTKKISNKLKSAVSLKKGSVLSQKDAQKDKDAIEGLLTNEHYHFAKLQEPILSKEKLLIWRIQLSDQAKFIFRSADPFVNDLFLDKSYDETDLLSHINLGQYSNLDKEVLDSIKKSIKTFYENYGHIGTSITYIEDFDRVNKRPQYIFYILEGKIYSFELRFSGLKRFKSSELTNILKKSSSRLLSGIFSRKDILDGLDTITNYYKSFGYLNVILNEPKIDLNKKKAHARVSIAIEEGKLTKVRSINFSGIPENDEDVLRTLSKIKIGPGLDPFQIETFLVSIENFYKDRGYFYVKVQTKDIVKYSNEDLYADINFIVKLGPITRIGEIILQGNYITHDRIIKRELGSYYIKLQRGKIYTQSIITAAQERISSTGVFQSVSIVPSINAEEPEVVDLIVKVVENYPGLVKYGVGYKNERGMRIFGSIINNNIGGMNRTAYVKGELNQQITTKTLEEKLNTEYLFQLGFIEPWLFNSRQRLIERLKFRGNFLWERRDTKSFRIDRRQNASLSLEKELSKYAELELTYQYEKDVGYNKVEDRNFSDIFALVSPTVEIDHRDNAFNPTRGLYNKIFSEYASPTFYSRYHFLKLWTHSNVYFPLRKKTVFAASLRLGTSKAFIDDDTGKRRLPILKRYFLGGRSTVRGYAQDRLGPKKNNKPLGGDRFINYKLELRNSLTKYFGIVFFLDGGNVYLSGYPYTIRHSWGLGLRYLTPIGPISFEYGIKINPETDERKSALHFSIGTF